MQTLAAYLIFLLVVVAVGLGIVSCAIIGLLSYQGIAWMKSRLKLLLWEQLVSGPIGPRSRIEKALGILGGSIRIQVFHVNQWMKQPF